MKNHALLVFAAAGMMLFTSGASAQEASTSPAEETTTPGENAPATEESVDTEESEDTESSETDKKESEGEGEESASASGPTEQAPPATNSAQPAVAPTPTADAPEKADDKNSDDDSEEDEEDEKPFKRPFADSQMYWENQFSAISLDKGHDYTYNPVYTMAFGIEPKWEVIKGLKLATALEFDTELTNSDFAGKRGEVFIKDIPFNVSYKHSFDINDDVKFSPGAGMGLLIPVSKVSRFSTLYTALSLKISLGLMFPKVLKGLMVGWTPSFKKYFHESKSPRPNENILDESGISPAEQMTSETFQALAFTGGINPSWSVGNSILIALSITEELSFSFLYGHSYIYKYAPTDMESATWETDPMGSGDPRDTGNNERGIYNNMFTYELSYSLPEPVNMFEAYVGAVTMSNQLNTDGSYHTPFFNRETLLAFGLRLNIDKTVSAFQGKKAQ